MYRVPDTNDIIVSGYLEGPFKFDHMVGEKRMFSSVLNVERNSGVIDRIVLRITEADVLKYPESLLIQKICIHGNINTLEKKPKIAMNVRVKDIWLAEDDFADKNAVTVSGVISKVYKVRSTTIGRPVRDFELISTNYYGKKIHIPIVVWDDYAININESDIGKEAVVTGRFQSRVVYTYDERNEKRTYTIYEIAAQNVRAV